MREKTRRSIKFALVAIFAVVAVFAIFKPEIGTAAGPTKVMPTLLVMDDSDKKQSENAGSFGKAPFDHDQHVAKDSCVTCHHTNSKKLTKAVEEEVQKCAVCHKADESKCETEGTNEDKKFKDLTALGSKEAFHGDDSLVGCLGCHKERNIEPVSCKACHTGEEKVEYKYKK